MQYAEFEKLLKEADTFTSKGKYKEAIELYFNALELDPGNPQVNRQLVQLLLKTEYYGKAYEHIISWAMVLINGNRLDDAQKVLQEGINLDPASGKKLSIIEKKSGQTQALKEAYENYSHQLYFLLGKVAYEKNNSDEAIANINKSLVSFRENAEAHLLLGLSYLRKEMDEKAKGEFQEVIRLAPENAAVAYEKLADIYDHQGKAVQNMVRFLKGAADTYLKKNQLDEASRVYQKIIQYEPENKEVLSRLGDLLVAKGLYSEAVQIYKHLTQIYSQEGLYDRVIQLYEKIIEWEPENTEIRNKIIEMYRTTLKIDPSNLSARHKLIENFLEKGATDEVVPEFLSLIATYIDKGLLKEAMKYCKQLRELDHNNLKAWSMLADLEFKTGNQEGAIITYFSLIAKLEDMGRLDEAKKIRDNLIVLIPGNEALYMKLGEECLEKGRNEEASGRFQAVCELNPKNIMALTFLGEVYQRKGEKEKAQTIYEKALQLDPDFAPAKERLTKLYEQIGEPQKLRETLEGIVTVLMEQNRFIEAVPILRKLLSLFPEDISLRITLFTALLGSDVTKEARVELLVLIRLLVKRELVMKTIEMLAQYLEKAPNDINSRIYLAKLAANSGQIGVAVKENIALAEWFLSQHFMSKAIQIYRSLIVLEPANYVYHQKVGELLVEEGQIDEALGHYLTLEEEYERNQMENEAEKVLVQILKLDPLNKDAAIKLANFSLLRGEHDESISILRDAATKAQASGNTRIAIPLYENIAKVHLELGNDKEAIKTQTLIADLYFNTSNEKLGVELLKTIAKQYLKLEDISSYKTCIQKLAASSYYKEDLEAVLELYRGVLIEIFPKDLNVGLLLADEVIQLLLAHGQIDRLAVFTTDIGGNLTGSREAAAFYQKMAEMGAQLYRLDEAISHYEKVVTLDPNALDAHLRLGELYLSRDEIDAASRAYLAAIGIYLSCNMFKEAMEVGEKVEKSFLSSPAFFTNLGDLWGKYNQPETTKKCYEIALKENNCFVPALSGIVATLAKEEEWENVVSFMFTVIPKGCISEILDEFEKVINTTTSVSQAHFILGKLYRNLGFVEEAIVELEEAIKEPAVFLEGVQCLGLLFAEQGFLDLGIRQLKMGLVAGYSDEELLSLRYSLAELYEKGYLFKDAFEQFNEIYAVDIRYRDVESCLKRLHQNLQKESSSKVVSFMPDKADRG